MTVTKLVAELMTALGDDRLLPDDELEKNTLGNLLIVRENAILGYMDLLTGEIDIWPTTPTSPRPRS